MRLPRLRQTLVSHIWFNPQNYYFCLDLVLMEILPPSTCMFCDGVKTSSAPSDDCSLASSGYGHTSLPLAIECLDSQPSQAILLYGSLDPLVTSQIRILELEPGVGTQPLVGRLFNADILLHGGVVETGTKRRHQYVAISYFWGMDQSPRYHLQCNGFNYPIPREAYRALHRVRDSRTQMLVWIDTVCINQHDDGDKALQVAAMRSIYQNAAEVVVYLGEYDISARSPAGNAVPAAELLFCLLKDCGSCQQDSGDSAWQISRQDFAVKHTRTLCAGHARLIECGVRELSELNWFDRIWIKQEVWAARSITIRYGGMTLPWSKLKSFEQSIASMVPALIEPRLAGLQSGAELLSRKLRRLVIGTPLSHAVADLDDRPNRSLTEKEPFEQDIINVLRRSEKAKCSRLHDRIYGLLSMTSVNVEAAISGKAPLNHFQISYEEHPAVTFTRLAKYIVQRDRAVNILLLDAAFPRPQGAGEVEGQTLPSWVPDWRFAIGKGPSYHAMMQSWTSTLPEMPELCVLRVKGFPLGTVSSWHFDDASNATVAVIKCTHPTVEADPDQLVHVPSTVHVQDILVSLTNVDGPVLIRPTGTSTTAYHYVGAVQPRDNMAINVYDSFHYLCYMYDLHKSEDPSGIGGYQIIDLV